MASPNHPVDNPITSFWLSGPHRLDDFQSIETLPDQADVVIIGSGFAGIATAYHIFEQAGPGTKPRIVILEARKLSSGATGRNGGHVKPDTFLNVTKKASIYGIKQAATLQKYETDQVYQIKQLVEKEDLDCDFHLTRACDAIIDPLVARTKHEEYQRMVKDGVVETKDIGYVGPKHAERISGVKGAQCCFTYTAAQLWPQKMVLQLLEKLIEQGLQAHANTPALDISPSESEKDSWKISTSRGSLTARKVVVCTNAYTSSILPKYKNKIIPVRGVCSHITSPKETPPLQSTYSLRFNPLMYDYMIPRADGSIVVGGAMRAFWHKRDSWWNNRNDDEVVAEATEYFENYMQRYFHAWENSGAKVESIWTGIMGYSSDMMPHVGEVPGRPGQFVCAGFTGHGMCQILCASRGVAAMMVKGSSFEQTGLPSLFKTTQTRIDSTENLMEDSVKEAWEQPKARL